MTVRARTVSSLPVRRRPAATAPTGGATPAATAEASTATAPPVAPAGVAGATGRPPEVIHGPSTAELTRPTAGQPAATPHRPRRARGWLALLVVAGLPLLLLLVADDDEPASPQGEAAATAEPGQAGDGATQPGPIGLPPPGGDVPRSRPLQTVWLLAPDLADAGLSGAVAEEAAAVVDYMGEHGLAGDGLAVGSGPLRRVGAADEALHAAVTPPLRHAGGPEQAAGTAGEALSGSVDDHAAVVVVTAEPDRWASVGADVAGRRRDQRDATADPPPAAADSPSAAEPQPTTGHYLIALRPGAGSSPELTGPGELAGRVTVDPTERGELATALARAFVESYGGRWQGETADTGDAVRQ